MEPPGLQRYGSSALESTAGMLASAYDVAQRAAAQHMAASPGLASAACQHFLAMLSLLGSLSLLAITIGLGWSLMWHTTLKDIGFFRDVMGLNRPKPGQQASQKADVAAQIEKLRRQHSRGGSKAAALSRANSLMRARSLAAQQQQQPEQQNGLASQPAQPQQQQQVLPERPRRLSDDWQDACADAEDVLELDAKDD